MDSPTSDQLIGIRFYCTTCADIIDHEKVHKGRSGWFHLKYSPPKCGGCPPRGTPHIVERQEIVGYLRDSSGQTKEKEG